MYRCISCHLEANDAGRIPADFSKMKISPGGVIELIEALYVVVFSGKSTCFKKNLNTSKPFLRTVASAQSREGNCQNALGGNICWKDKTLLIGFLEGCRIGSTVQYREEETTVMLSTYIIIVMPVDKTRGKSTTRNKI